MSVTFLLLLFVVAFLYASVGHGGASGYLALMALFAFNTDFMKPTALMLNVCVSIIAFVTYYKQGYFSWKLFLYFAILSIPFSYLGGTIAIDNNIYKKTLGVLLWFPILKMLFFSKTEVQALKTVNVYLALIVGAIIGFLSGLIGIGGGILLSPIMILLHYANQKRAAAVSALFIFANSIAGLVGQISVGIHFQANMVIFVLVAVVAGFLGSNFGAKRVSNQILKYILASVLILASVKLILV